MFLWLGLAFAGCRGDHGWRGGTCFFVSPQGMAVTSRHVIVDHRRLMVFDADGRRSRARVIAEDPLLDLAVLQTRLGAPAYLELSAEDANLGDPVSSFDPIRLQPKAGLIVGRRGLGSDDLLATTALAERGSSGGPLIDRAGRVVGVLVRLQPESKVAFAVKASRLGLLLHAMPRTHVALPARPERAVCRVAAP